MAGARHDDARSIPKPVEFNMRKYQDTTQDLTFLSTLEETLGRGIG